MDPTPTQASESTTLLQVFSFFVPTVDTTDFIPRVAIQLTSFHSALARIAAGEDLALTAADCGYSDQAHMARQIKQIAGLPPSSLRRRLGERAYRALSESRPGAPWLEQGNVPAP
jgi:hypothetical protein